MLRVDLSGTGGFLYARQGSMVAYQGEVDFSYEGSGADLLGRARRLSAPLWLRRRERGGSAHGGPATVTP